MIRRRLNVLAISSLFVLAVGSAYLMGRARAAGAPSVQPLTYSGTLSDAGGVSLTGSKNIQVQFWDATSAGNIVCTTPSTAQALVAGSFSVTLPDACVTAVRARVDVWTEVLVDGASTGRVKVGAVPYALEASAAVVATSAGTASVGGEIDTRLKKIEAVTPLTQVVAVTIGPESFADADSKSHMTSCNANFNAVSCSLLANRYCTANGYKAGIFVGESADGSHRAVNCIK